MNLEISQNLLKRAIQTEAGWKNLVSAIKSSADPEASKQTVIDFFHQITPETK